MENQMRNKSMYHWLVVAACSLIMVGAIGMIFNCAGLFYTPVADDLGIGRGSIALYATISNLVGGFFSPVVSKMMEKINLTLMLTIGIVLECTAFGALSVCSNAFMFYIFAVFIGVGYCMCTSIPLLMVLSNWFEKMNGLVTGILMASMGVGGAIFTQITNALINAVGWRTSYIITAIISLAIGLPGILFIIRLTPESKGFLPYGAMAPRVHNADKATDTDTSKKQSIVTVVLVTLCIAGMLAAGSNAMNSHFAGYTVEIGVDSSVGALMMTGCMISNIVCNLLFGVMSDKIGPYVSVVIFMTISSATLLVLTITSIQSSAVLLVLGFLYGTCYTFCPTALPLIIRKIYGLENYSRAFSIINMFTNAGYAAFLTIIGYIYDFTGTYRIATLVCMILAIAGTATVLLSASLAKKRIMK